jgi:hypothetical protein
MLGLGGLFLLGGSVIACLLITCKTARYFRRRSAKVAALKDSKEKSQPAVANDAAVRTGAQGSAPTPGQDNSPPRSPGEDTNPSVVAASVTQLTSPGGVSTVNPVSFVRSKGMLVHVRAQSPAVSPAVSERMDKSRASMSSEGSFGAGVLPFCR